MVKRQQRPTNASARAARWSRAAHVYAVCSCTIAAVVGVPLAAFMGLGAIMTGGGQYLREFTALYVGLVCTGAVAAVPGFAAERSWQRSRRPMRWQRAALYAALPWAAWIPLPLLAAWVGATWDEWSVYVVVVLGAIPFGSWIPVVALRAEWRVWDAAALSTL